MTGFVVKSSRRYRGMMCYDVIGLCLKYIRDHSRFNNEHNGESLRDHLLRRKRFFILTSDNFCISTLTNLKLEMTIFVIMMAKWMDQFVVRSNGQNHLWSWKCQQCCHRPYVHSTYRIFVKQISYPCMMYMVKVCRPNLDSNHSSL